MRAMTDKPRRGRALVYDIDTRRIDAALH